MEFTTAQARKQQERRLWLIALAIACTVTLLALWCLGLLMLHSSARTTARTLPKAPNPMVIAVSPLPTPQPPPPIPKPEQKTPKRFARTSPDQTSAIPEKPDFIGDRDTIATSDALPAAGAPAMPSQKGRDPRRPDDIETTESTPQDGPLEHDQVASMPSQPATSSSSPANTDPSPSPIPTPLATTPSPQKTSQSPPQTAATDAKNVTATDAPTLPGDQVVERPMTEEALKTQKAQNTPDLAASTPPPPSLPKPTPPQPNRPPKEPGFRGNQSKTKITGSIKRQGRSALNVANTAMGRYHSKLSRAVEAEWHRNCAKYRDFITPGILTIRFVIDPNGSVRSVNVVEMVDAGEVQKGFTLNSIRQAKIPPIPAELKAEIEDDPIEITYNFYF